MAAICASSGPTVLWARRPELCDAIAASGRNHDYLPDVKLPASLEYTSDLAAAVAGAGTVIVAVPSHGFRAVVRSAAGELTPGVPLVSLAKGLEAGTLARMTQIIAEEAPGQVRAVLTGPNLAGEVAVGQPTASVVAGDDAEALARLQALLSTDTFRVYRNADVVGCEIAGALKNVIAIAAGMAEGMGFGDNTRAALITRGLAELTRLGVALGGDPLTFSGLAGMGDLVATCTSTRSRNHRVGVELGRGRALRDILADTTMVAEGVKTAPTVSELAGRHDVEMPIAAAVCAVLDGSITPAEMVSRLMRREAKPEVYGLPGR